MRTLSVEDVLTEARVRNSLILQAKPVGICVSVLDKNQTQWTDLGVVTEETAKKLNDLGIKTFLRD